MSEPTMMVWGGVRQWITLPELADALRPLLAQPEQPAADDADVLALDAKLQRAELRAADLADTIKAQAATIRRLTRECDELAAKWAAVPWEGLPKNAWDDATSQWWRSNRPRPTD